MFLLSLVYAWLAAAEAGDQAAVDTAMEPLDRAAARWPSEQPRAPLEAPQARIGAYLSSLDDRGFPRDTIESDWLGRSCS
ncbi:hypothetical protein AB0I68_33085 [Streptomyces sp. NPDC050448]|uniref:hypothetical protein n=1 Tax=Streptomyces sp. NPDC050448 TaxID=3155404 RepID=UPI003427AC42